MRFKKVYSFIAIQLFLLPDSVFSEQERPKVILALSGGGARGLAHVGILKYFEENRIPVDGIVGTSIGGLVGATYAMGHSISELENIISHLNFEDLLNLSLNYTDLTLETKKKLRKYPISINLAKSKNASLYQAHAISQFFDRLTLLYSHIEDFNKYPIPFKCVATDIIKGESVILDSGVLPKALRATMAIPGLFPPVSWGDKLLVDGGVLNNLPCDVARTMGEMVIAVDVSEGLQPGSKLKNVSSLLNQTITVMMSQNLKKSVAMANICLRPDIQGFGLLEIKKSKDIIQKGYDEAKKMEKQLLPLALSELMWKEYIDKKNEKINLYEFPEISYIVAHSKDPKVSKWLAKDIQPFVKAEKGLDLKKLESRLTLALDKVGASRIHYRLIEPMAEEDIKKPSEKYTTTYQPIKKKILLSNEELVEHQGGDSDAGGQTNKIKDLASGIVDRPPVSSLENISVDKDTLDFSKEENGKGFGRSSVESVEVKKEGSGSQDEGGFGRSVSSLPDSKSQGFGIEVVSVDDTKKKSNLSAGIEVTGSKDNVQMSLGSRLTKKTSFSTTEVDFNLGSNINVVYGQRFNFGHSISVKPQVFFGNDINYYKSSISPYPLLTDRISNYGVNLDLNWGIGNSIGFRGRYQFRKSKLPSSFIQSVSNVMSGNFQTVSLKGMYDQQNNASIVTKGLKVSGEANYYLSSPQVLGSLSSIGKKPVKLEFQGSYAHPVGNKGIIRVNSGIGYVNNNTLPLNELFSLGGPLKLSTFQDGELRNAAYILTSVGFLYSIKSFSFFPGKNTYISVWGERGGVGPTRKSILMTQNLFAGLLVDSSLGPVFIGGSYGANKKLNFNFGIGNFF